MTLRQKQSAFAYHEALLVLHIYESGYEVTLGDAQRSRTEAVRLGFKDSLHTLKLAVDLNLFRNGRYLRSTKSHLPFGEWWEDQHDLARWGGRFQDGNHYAFTHGGRV